MSLHSAGVGCSTWSDVFGCECPGTAPVVPAAAAGPVCQFCGHGQFWQGIPPICRKCLKGVPRPAPVLFEPPRAPVLDLFQPGHIPRQASKPTPAPEPEQPSLPGSTHDAPGQPPEGAVAAPQAPEQAQEALPANDAHDAPPDIGVTRARVRPKRELRHERHSPVETVRIGSATLYRGDCRLILPTLPAVDALVTDPPYGTGFVGGYGRAGETILNDDDLGVVAEALAIARLVCGGNGLVFYSPRVVPAFLKAVCGYEWGGEIVWDKVGSGMGGGLRYQHENIAVLGDVTMLTGAFSVISVYRDAEEHPHQKPRQLMDRLIAKYSAQTICDPFMGSGSTGVSCAALGRTFVGIELDAKHFETACRRIEEAHAQGRLFVDQTPPPLQRDVFAQPGAEARS